MSNISLLTREDLRILSASFEEEKICVKIQSLSKDRKHAQLVCYLHHTDVYERIEKVDLCWSAEIRGIECRGTLYYVRVALTIKGLIRENFGEGKDPKSATSDALKRAAMLFGIGRYLYDVEKVWVLYNETRDKYRTFLYADYRAAFRGKQDSAREQKNVGESIEKGKPFRPTQLNSRPSSGPGNVPHAGPPSRPSARPAVIQKGRPASNGKLSKAQLGTKIVAAAEEIRLPEDEMKNWIWDHFKKDPNDLEVKELEEFLHILEREKKVEVC